MATLSEEEYQLVPSPVWGGLPALSLHFGYNRWANGRILLQAANLSETELMAPNQTTHDSAFQLLLHTLDSEWSWRIVCQEGIKTPLLWEAEKIPDLDTLMHFWLGEFERMDAYLKSMKDSDLNCEVDYGSILSDHVQSATVLNLLTHILYHSHNHRTELAIYLTQCGHSPGDLDFLNYLTQATA